jgi:starch-binding outer membrane protein, SusD/RagB family
MNTSKIKLAIGALSLVVVASCNKSQLNLNPSSEIALNESFEQTSDAQKWDLGMYAALRSNTYGQFIMATDIQADQLNATVDYGNNYGGQHTWAGFSADDGFISSFWSQYYSALASINVAIPGYATIKDTTAAGNASLQQYLGDAYLFRAYYYHELVLRYAKAYNPTTAATDPGVPLVLTYNVDLKPARATVAQVYTQILNDIDTARALLNNVSGQLGSILFTKDAAIALEARVKLCMQDWAGAKLAADSLINSGTYPLVTTASDLSNMWANDVPNETIMYDTASQPNEAPNAENMYISFNSATGDNDPFYVPSQWIVDLYDNADLRKGVYFLNTTATFRGTQYTGVWLVNKFPGNPAFWTGAYSNYQQAPKIFRIAEDYLISAEAAFQAGNTTAAATTLNSLRTARGLPALPSVALQDIMDERTRELAFEGFRLDDLKRWNLGFTRYDPQNTAFLVTGSNYTTLNEPAGAPKYVWGLPTNDMSLNPNLVQNPGW